MRWERNTDSNQSLQHPAFIKYVSVRSVQSLQEHRSDSWTSVNFCAGSERARERSGSSALGDLARTIRV